MQNPPFIKAGFNVKLKEKGRRNRVNRPSEELATPLLLPFPLPTHPTYLSTTVCDISVLLVTNSHSDSCIEDFLDANVLFGRALHISGTHALCHCQTLLRCDRCETLGFEQINAGLFVSEVGFQAEKDKRCCRAEMENFWIPLFYLLLAQILQL
jgi:hypothetical protein